MNDEWNEDSGMISDMNSDMNSDGYTFTCFHNFIRYIIRLRFLTGC